VNDVADLVSHDLVRTVRRQLEQEEASVRLWQALVRLLSWGDVLIAYLELEVLVLSYPVAPPAESDEQRPILFGERLHHFPKGDDHRMGLAVGAREGGVLLEGVEVDAVLAFDHRLEFAPLEQAQEF